MDRVLPDYVPFVTFFLAVAMAGWLGGFGPAVFAMALGALIARYFYMVPVNTFHLHELTTAVALGMFVFVCLVIGVLTSTLHSALRRIQVLSSQLEALGVAQQTADHANGRNPPSDRSDGGQRSLSTQD
jgi:K+-sensing histidine kinase KdpD